MERKMNTNQKYQFRQLSENRTSLFSAENQGENPQKRPGIPIPNEPTIPEQPDENPNPNSPEPGINKPEKDDPTRIDEEPPIFNNY
jgi:hypothetical protein